MDKPIENQNLNKTQYITAEELIDQLEAAGLHEIAETIKDSPKAAYNVAEDILITNKLNNMPEGSFAKTNFSKEDLEKYHNMSEEIIAQMLLAKKNSFNNLLEGSLSKQVFSQEDLEKFSNMSEETIAQMLLDKQKLPIGSKISELRENFNPTTSDNDNKPTNK